MTVTVCRDASHLAARAADFIAAAAEIAIRDRQRFTIALAGGSTPEAAYLLLANRPGIDWARVHVFFGDDRHVTHDDPRSNVGMARRALLNHVRATVYPIPTDLPSAEACAAAYEQTLLDVSGDPPQFDLVLLGLGDDGHVASLFPGKPALAATTWVAASPPGVLPPPVDRVTLTFRTINAARAVLFLVGGEKKAAVVARVLSGTSDFPAASVRPTSGTVDWFLDEAAASALK